VELADKPPTLAWEKVKKRAKGAAKQGHSFERHVRRTIRDAIEPPLLHLPGPWLRFHDQNGPGWAQPDHLVVAPTWALIVEAKRSQTEIAFLQMEELYAPLLQWLLQREIYTLQACKYLRYRPERRSTLREFLDSPKPGRHTWHAVGA